MQYISYFIDFLFRYFKAMAKGETPPVKDRLEMPVATQKTDTGLTPGLLRVLNKQVETSVTVLMLTVFSVLQTLLSSLILCDKEISIQMFHGFLFFYYVLRYRRCKFGQLFDDPLK